MPLSKLSATGITGSPKATHSEPVAAIKRCCHRPPGLRSLAEKTQSIVNRILKFLLASDVSLRCLDRRVSKQELNLFELAAAIMAESGTGATKIVRRQIGYAGLPGTPFDRIPDYVRCHASILSHSHF